MAQVQPQIPVLEWFQQLRWLQVDQGFLCESTRLWVVVLEGRMAPCLSHAPRWSVFNSLDMAFGGCPRAGPC